MIPSLTKIKNWNEFFAVDSFFYHRQKAIKELYYGEYLHCWDNFDRKKKEFVGQKLLFFLLSA